MEHRIATRDEWLAARKLLLTKEKEHTRVSDELNRQRRELPWVRVEKGYVFDAPTGKITLAQLFDGRSQLFIKHFMMGPGAAHKCVGCSLEVDHVDGLLEHLQNHDVTYAVVARAPIEEIEAVRKRMGWRFPWVSSYYSDFNYDLNVSFEDLHWIDAEPRSFWTCSLTVSLVRASSCWSITDPSAIPSGAAAPATPLRLDPLDGPRADEMLRALLGRGCEPDRPEVDARRRLACALVHLLR
jgi:hypothetical protein